MQRLRRSNSRQIKRKAIPIWWCFGLQWTSDQLLSRVQEQNQTWGSTWNCTAGKCFLGFWPIKIFFCLKSKPRLAALQPLSDAPSCGSLPSNSLLPNYKLCTHVAQTGPTRLPIRFCQRRGAQPSHQLRGITSIRTRRDRGQAGLILCLILPAHGSCNYEQSGSGGHLPPPTSYNGPQAFLPLCSTQIGERNEWLHGDIKRPNCDLCSISFVFLYIYLKKKTAQLPKWSSELFRHLLRTLVLLLDTTILGNIDTLLCTSSPYMTDLHSEEFGSISPCQYFKCS